MELLEKVKLSESNYLSSHWSELLKCPVCFSYFDDPVNLFCGHTFCKRCLMTMAQNTRKQCPDIPYTRLRMWCPTCRHAVPVRLYVGPDMNICYVLRDIVYAWMVEKQKVFRSSPQYCRSISTQTIGPLCTHSYPWDDADNGTHVPSDMHSMDADSEICAEERFVHVKPDCMAPFHFADKNENRRDLAPDFSESDVYDSEDISSDEADDVAFTDHIVPDVDVIQRHDLTPRKMWMLVFWVVYTGVMAVISHGFLPYIIVYSLVLLLIIYVDNMQHQAIQLTNQ